MSTGWTLLLIEGHFELRPWVFDVMRCCHWISSLVGCVALAAPGVAAALEVRWEAPSACPTRDELMYRIERALGSPAQLPPGQFEVRANHTAGGYEARLEAASAQGTTDKVRLLRAGDCDRLADVVALAIALASGAERIDKPASEGHAAPIESAATTVSNAPQGSAPSTNDAVNATREPSTRGGPDWGFSVSVIGDSGSLPELAVGPTLGTQLSWSRVQLRAGIAFFSNEAVLGRVIDYGEFRTDVGSTMGVGRPRMDTDLFFADALGCGALWGSFLDDYALTLCGGLEVGTLRAKAAHIADSQRASHAWLAASASVGGSIAVPSTSLRVGAWLGSAWLANTATFRIKDTTAQFEPARLPLRASVGIDWTVW